jgi:hypothetical protein
VDSVCVPWPSMSRGVFMDTFNTPAAEA